MVPSLREAQTYASPRLPGCQPIAPKPTAAPVQVGRRDLFMLFASRASLFKFAMSCEVLDSLPGFAAVQHTPASLQTGAQ